MSQYRSISIGGRELSFRYPCCVVELGGDRGLTVSAKYYAKDGGETMLDVSPDEAPDDGLSDGLKDRRSFCVYRRINAGNEDTVVSFYIEENNSIGITEIGFYGFAEPGVQEKPSCLKAPYTVYFVNSGENRLTLLHDVLTYDKNGDQTWKQSQEPLEPRAISSPVTHSALALQALQASLQALTDKVSQSGEEAEEALRKRAEAYVDAFRKGGMELSSAQALASFLVRYSDEAIRYAMFLIKHGVAPEDAFAVAQHEEELTPEDDERPLTLQMLKAKSRALPSREAFTAYLCDWIDTLRDEDKIEPESVWDVTDLFA